MIPYGHFDYFVIRSLMPFAPVPIRHDLGAGDAKVVRFEEDGTVAAAGTDGNVERLEFTVPHLPGMTELAVERAGVTLRGRRVDQAPAATPKTSPSADMILPGRAGRLHTIDLAGLSIVPDGTKPLRLSATSGSPGFFRFVKDGTGSALSRTGGNGDHEVHVMVRPKDPASGSFGPPAAAAPHYDMPDQDRSNPLYGPVLSGASLRLDVPSRGDARLELKPSIAAEDVKVFFGTNDEKEPHAGLPHEASGVDWTSERVTGTWSVAPTDVTVNAAAGDAAPVLVADFPGEFPESDTVVDFSPAARSLLGGAYDPAGSGDLLLTLDASAMSAGELLATKLDLTAHYVLTGIGAEPVPVSLRGALERLDVPVAPGLRPHRIELTIDGRFGPGVLVAGSDRDGPGRRAGVRLAGSTRAMRRLSLTAGERSRPLFRIGLLGRASEPAEVMLTLRRDQGGRPGPPLADPAGVRAHPSAQPAWHRVELPAPTGPAAGEAVWVEAHATTGTFWWYADADAGPDRLAQVSVDDGASWAATPSRPCTQVHYRSERPEPGRIAVHSPLGVLTDDLLALAARRSIVETTGLDALGRGLTVGRDGALAADPAAPATVEQIGAAPASVTFRKEGMQPLAAGALAGVAGVGDALTLTFSCDRDADFGVSDARITYHPWQARAGAG